MPASRDDLQALCAELEEAVGEQFAANPRREQFQHHLKTVSMCIDHLFDEDERTHQ
jgi:hypothetical protein